MGLTLQRFLLLMLCSLGTISTWAEEGLQSPVWRGQPGSSFQLWNFTFINEGDNDKRSSFCENFGEHQTPWGHRSPPEILDNPYEKSAGICVELRSPWMISGGMDWLRQYKEGQGVWVLRWNKYLPVFLNFMVTNTRQGTGKQAQHHVRVIYRMRSSEPQLFLRYPSENSDHPFISVPPTKKYDMVELPGQWKLQSYLFEIPACPHYHIVQILPSVGREAIYIDEVSIDSICKDG